MPEVRDLPPCRCGRNAAERARIAEHLANAVVHQVFRVSLDLHAALSRLGGEQHPAADKIRSAIEGLDETIRDLRAVALDAHPECAL